MARYILFAILPVLLVLSGCAGNKYEKNNDMRANLEPEVWDTTQILKDLKRGRPLTKQEKEALASRGAIQFNLDVADNEEVQMFLQYFSMDKRGTMDKWLTRAQPYLPYVRAVLASYNLPPDLIVLPFIESGYSTMAYSPVGAGGMWQFMPYTARRFGLTVDWWVDERRDPYKSTVAAAKYLSKLYQMFGDWNLALAAYNAGEGKISRVMAASGQCDFFDIAKDPKLLKAETRHYVPKFLAVLKIFQNLQTLGFHKVNWQAGPNLKEVPAPGGTDLAALAQACGLSWDQFREYNPGFRRMVSPPDATVNVYVPVAKEPIALAYLKTPGNYPSSGLQTVTAQAGETWWALARRANMPVAELRQLNPSLPETLPSGQTVRVAASAFSIDNTALAEGPAAACAPKALASAAKPQRHRVNKGESIGSIARKYGVSTKELMAANRMKRAGRLTLGAWLVIPQSASSRSIQTASASHTVQRGETISGIADKYNVDPDALMAANHLRSARDLLAGQKLSIPGGKSSAPAVAAAALPSTTYTVRAGDTLSGISRRFNVDSRQLAAANNLSSSVVRIGQSLTIPGSGQRPRTFAARDPEPTKKNLWAPKAQAQAEKHPAAAKTPPTPQKRQAAKSVNYKVSPGETVWGIAKKFNVEPSSLMAWNNMKSPSALQAGSQITIRKD
ncbi:Lytic transglycosylase catalytic [Solidesulfovibrio fructosivorans JJ]]|uniref:Lytic transglycosylase catalytic n=1 Tax=Solidesulfovibrio fructosivorans JJ] TaxID=596151 RepID=E1K2A0_SOLFR|nr:LysM peptidoglycan-binding domain-containing protein [Solidesulfovibrio fructosivorans]EFL49255.1 Lytic transglycosylase catalytic [Solidesulfovibrio fructosivorans JJ]]